MANQWFRLYGEFAHDAKVQMLSECNQRRLIMLFCIRCNGDVTLHDDEVTFQLRVTDYEWAETKAIFISKGFINKDNELLNWDKRQFISDSSAERVAKHRAKIKADVTPSNVTVTLPEQNRTEQIQNRTEHKKHIVAKAPNNDDNFLDFWCWYPKKVGKDAAYKAWNKCKPNYDLLFKTLMWQKESKQWQAEDGKYIPNPATYLNQGRWQDEAPIQENPF